MHTGLHTDEVGDAVLDLGQRFGENCFLDFQRLFWRCYFHGLVSEQYFDFMNNLRDLLLTC